MYDELFSKVPDHPRLTRHQDATLSVFAINEKRQLVNKYIDKSKVFVEWGPGDCKFAIDLCKDVNFVFGIDVANQIAKDKEIPDNFKLIVFDVYHLDIENDFADVVFSDQLIEHIPPDDAPYTSMQLRAFSNQEGFIFVEVHTAMQGLLIFQSTSLS